MTLRPGTCSCPVPSGLIFMSSFSPSLLSRSLKVRKKQMIKRSALSGFKLSHLKKAERTVPQDLIVDLHRADGDSVRPHVLPLLNLSKEMFESSLVDAWVLHTALEIQRMLRLHLLDCSMGAVMMLNKNKPPWCTFSQSQSVHTQICRHGSHQCRTSPEAQSPERPDETEHTVQQLVMMILPACAAHFDTSSCVA